MHILSRARSGGKTTAAVKWAAEDPERIILVANQPAARHVADLLEANLLAAGVPQEEAHDRAGQQVVPPSGLQRGYIRHRLADVAMVVDNVDDVLRELLGVAPVWVTFTGSVDADTRPAAV